MSWKLWSDFIGDATYQGQRQAVMTLDAILTPFPQNFAVVWGMRLWVFMVFTRRLHLPPELARLLVAAWVTASYAYIQRRRRVMRAWRSDGQDPPQMRRYYGPGF